MPIAVVTQYLLIQIPRARVYTYVSAYVVTNFSFGKLILSEECRKCCAVRNYRKVPKVANPESSDKISQVLATLDSSFFPPHENNPTLRKYMKRYAKLIRGLLSMIDMIFDIPIQSTYVTLRANDVHYLFWAQLSVCNDTVLLNR